MTTPKRFYLEHDKFRFLRLFLQQREIYFIAGTNSLFVPERNEKYVQYNRPDGTKVCREWPTLEGEMIEMTPGEAARTELQRTFPGLRRVGWMAGHVKLFDWRWPMMFSGPMIGTGTYIDLKGAYWQIYKRLWLDVAFPCGYGTLALAGVADRLKDWKGARNSLVGVTAARQTMGVKGYRSFQLSTQNPFLAPCLWATIQGILNELAYQAEECGAQYIATDGYIFPGRTNVLKFKELLYDVGLTFSEASGEMDVKSWGRYKVGKKQTASYELDESRVAANFRSINLPDSRQPQYLLRWWAHSIPMYNLQKWSAPYDSAKQYV